MLERVGFLSSCIKHGIDEAYYMDTKSNTIEFNLVQFIDILSTKPLLENAKLMAPKEYLEFYNEAFDAVVSANTLLRWSLKNHLDLMVKVFFNGYYS